MCGRLIFFYASFTNGVISQTQIEKVFLSDSVQLVDLTPILICLCLISTDPSFFWQRAQIYVPFPV
jgi:hypothetical protein